MTEDLRIGIIGFDTSHVPAFTRLLNDPSDPHHVPGGRVVAGYPSYSADIQSSISRVESYKREISEGYNVRLVDSIAELIEQTDAILLESVDGRRHLAEALPVLRAGKPLYIDKPLAASYHDAATIAGLAAEHGCPVFSSSSLRFDVNISALKADPDIGAIKACDAFSPAHLEPTNPGLFWYGVHGVEILYTFMGSGCHGVYAHSTEGYDLVVGEWPEGRLGSVRGIRDGALDYGATVFGTKRVGHTTYSQEVPIYARLLEQAMAFFQSGRAPVPIEETLEIMAFMQAALQSQECGRRVELTEVLGPKQGASQ